MAIDMEPQRRHAGAALAPLRIAPMADLIGGALRWRIWGRLGWLDTKRRYRRTILGPFWSAVSLAIFIAALGSIGVALWKQNPTTYVPYLAAGMVVWVMIQTIITESCIIFIHSHQLFKQMRIEYSIFVYSMVWRNLIFFAHNFIVYFVVMLIFAPEKLDWHLLLLPVGLFFLTINAIWIALFIGLACHRYRDLQQLVGTLVQITIFVTPIFWPADLLTATSRTIFVTFNPIYHLIEVVRRPLIGEMPANSTYIFLIAMWAVGTAITVWLFQRYRARIAFWG